MNIRYVRTYLRTYAHIVMPSHRSPERQELQSRELPEIEAIAQHFAAVMASPST